MIYPTGIIHNTKAGTFHPISFRVAPLPGGHQLPSASRYKSVGHHTAGFPTVEGALAWIAANDACRPVWLLYEWDGEGVPAMVEFIPDFAVCSV